MNNNQYEQRRQNVAGELSERKLDCMLVAFSPDLRYLSGFTGSSGALLVFPDRSSCSPTPGTDTGRPGIHLQDPYRQGPADGRRAVGAGQGGRQADWVRARPHDLRHFESIKSRLPMGASLEPVSGWIEGLRMTKSAAELDLIRRSVETNSRAFEQAIARHQARYSEHNLAAELEYRMRRLGAEKPSFETIVATGVRSALPHAQPTAARLTAGDLVVVDMGAFQDGYASDMTRMLSVGSPSTKVKRMYRAVLEAQLAAIDAVRPGVTTVSVDAAARRVLAGFGLDHVFIHSTGHGLGLEIHEPPRLGKRDRHRLRAGMAITIEPGAYIEGLRRGAVSKIPSVVGKTGCEILTTTPKDLHIV